jgi:hypothetical protein
LALKEREYVLASRSIGAPSRRIILRHILPNVVSPVMVAATLGIAEAIITEIFAKEGKKDFEFKLSESYQTMDYCVQYRETDLAFVSRLMEQHGIYYFFEHSAGGHKMILTDSKAGHKPVKSKMAPPATMMR